jgi:phosphoribosylformylglycinamidine synthase
MISRIYVIQRGKDNKEGVYLKSWNELEINRKVKGVKILDSYKIQHELGESAVEKIANSLTNKILEKFYVDQIPSKRFTYAIEIGFLPGVTDNVGNTAHESIADLLHIKNKTLAVYSSRVFLISGNIKLDDAKKIAGTLHNPLIESAYIASIEEVKKNKDIPLRVPEVVLEKRVPVIDVSLKVHDDELKKIGKEGIVDPNGTRRGPLALELPYMKAIQAHFSKLKRNPTDIELESLAQTWSEHCKHTIFANPIDEIEDGLYKTFIRGATNLIRKKKGKKDFCVSVFSDNAGGIVFDKDYLLAHKVETHNSPSALDPYGGAITGIVGVNRDIIGFGLGAKPVANVYGFCVGEPNDERILYLNENRTQKMFPPKRIMDGVIKGVNAGGNTSGIPTVSGFIKFDDRFKGKPLVFAGTLGIIPRKINNRLSHEKQAEAGDYIVVVGGRVGRDGVHGATFSSVTLDSHSPVGAVQIGDPITQKKLSDAVVKEARAMNLYNSITDNGAGGISCSVAEMAKECGGAQVILDEVPLKYPGLRPWEIWISESQERMTLAVPPKKWEVFKQLMESRGVEATVIGEFTDSGKCVVQYQNKVIMDISLEFLHNGLPKIHLETENFINKYEEPKRQKSSNYTKIFEELVGVNNVAGFSFISEQYDHEVQASSVLKPLSGRGRINTDAQVFKPVLSSPKGVVSTLALYPSYGDISTYHMTACAIDTAIRNTISAGGTLSNLAILDNFCWCSSHDKKRLKELVESLKACHKYAVGYGTPFISGKDSMFNDFNGYNEKGEKIKISIPPTILISAISVMEDLNKTISPEFKNSGDVIYLLGETNNELGAGEYFKLLARKEKNNAIGNTVPKVNIEKNLKTYQVLEKVIKNELIVSALSVSSGGLSVALAKASIGGNLGCEIDIEKLKGNAKENDTKLFSESQGRVLVSVSPRNVNKFEKMIKSIPHTKLGRTINHKLIIKNNKEIIISSNVKKLTEIYHDFSNQNK